MTVEELERQQRGEIRRDLMPQPAGAEAPRDYLMAGATIPMQPASTLRRRLSPDSSDDTDHMDSPDTTLKRTLNMLPARSDVTDGRGVERGEGSDAPLQRMPLVGASVADSISAMTLLGPAPRSLAATTVVPSVYTAAVTSRDSERGAGDASTPLQSQLAALQLVSTQSSLHAQQPLDQPQHQVGAGPTETQGAATPVRTSTAPFFTPQQATVGATQRSLAAAMTSSQASVMPPCMPDGTILISPMAFERSSPQVVSKQSRLDPATSLLGSAYCMIIVTDECCRGGFFSVGKQPVTAISH